MVIWDSNGLVKKTIEGRIDASILYSRCFWSLSHGRANLVCPSKNGTAQQNGLPVAQTMVEPLHGLLKLGQVVRQILLRMHRHHGARGTSMMFDAQRLANENGTRTKKVANATSCLEPPKVIESEHVLKRN